MQKKKKPEHMPPSRIVENKQKIAIGLLANRTFRSGPSSRLICFLREFEEFLWNVRQADLYAIGGAYTAIRRAGLLAGYPGLKRIAQGKYGGIVPITAMVVEESPKRNTPQLKAVIYFMDPRDPTSLYPESLALKRECVVAKRIFLATYASAHEWATLSWFKQTGDQATMSRGWPSGVFLCKDLHSRLLERKPEIRKKLVLGEQTIALIAHDRKKKEMLSFALKNFDILDAFKARLATGTTGTLLNGERPKRFSAAEMRELEPEFSKLKDRLEKRRVVEGMPEEAWVQAQPSGPRGGDVQIAEEVFEGKCQKVVFFEDPHVSREHEADIQLLERTCRIPENDALCLHDYSTASVWADRLRCAVDKIGSMPVTLHHAYRLLFNVELILAPRRHVDLMGLARTVRPLNESELWGLVLERAAYYVLGIIAQRARERADVAQHARVVMTWGDGMNQLCEQIGAVAKSLRRDLGIETGTLEERFVRPENVIVSPMVGIMGATNPQVEANTNAAALSRILGGSHESLSSGAFIDKSSHIEPDHLVEAWDRADIALFTCDQVKPTFGSTATAQMPPLLHREMENAVGELGGMFLLEDGKERPPRKYRRVGMHYRQLQVVAKRGGAILVAGVQSRRMKPALVCLRGRLASAFVTDHDLAWDILRCELSSEYR